MKLRTFGAIMAAITLTASIAGATVTSAQDKSLTIWTKFNDKNTAENAPATDTWMKNLIAAYASDGVTLENTFISYDRINGELNTAVAASGTVPAVSYVDSQYLGLHAGNGNLQDLTEWAKAQTWYSDLDPAALTACTAPDGKLLCIPANTNTYFLYYWKSLFPNGFPADTDAMLIEAARLKGENKFVITFKGSEGASVERVYFPLILSYGGELVDSEGKAAWANEGAVKAVQFIRELVQNQYVPETVLTTGFDYEEAFKQGESGAFVAGTFSYVYLTPLTAPTGEKFDKAPPATGFDKNAIAIGDAYDQGLLDFALPLSAPGGEPKALVNSSAFGIPTNSPDADGAKAFLNWFMTTERNVEFAASYGALPSLKTAVADPTFSSAYWQQAAKAQAEAGVAAPAWEAYDDATRLLSVAIVNCLTNPDADILTELQSAQDEYNTLIE